MANFKEFINHEEVHLSRAVNKVGTLQGLIRGKISDFLAARTKRNKEERRWLIDLKSMMM